MTYQNYLGVYFFSNAADTKTGFNGVVRMITDAGLFILYFIRLVRKTGELIRVLEEKG